MTSYIETVFTIYKIPITVCAADQVITNDDPSNAFFSIVRDRVTEEANKIETFSLAGVYSTDGGSVSRNTCAITSIKVFADNQGSTELLTADGFTVVENAGVYSVQVNLKDIDFDPQTTLYLQVSTLASVIYSSFTIWVKSCNQVITPAGPQSFDVALNQGNFNLLTA